MSRRQVAPGVWLQEEPATPAHHRRTYAGIPVAVGSAMQPILTNGGNFMPGREAWKLPALHIDHDWRRTQAREASRRYRAKRA